jgi:hypothetical protein
MLTRSSGSSPSNDSDNNGSTISTIYYAPLTITASGYCTGKTSYSYITMQPLTGSALGALTSGLASVTPFTAVTVPGATPTVGAIPSGGYLQVDVFLSQAPAGVSLNGEESAWVKACYDPRDNPTLCPSTDVYGPNQAGVSCITGFPGAGAAPATTTGAAATVYGPYKNAAGGASWKGREAQGRLQLEIAVVVGVIAGLAFL